MTMGIICYYSINTYPEIKFHTVRRAIENPLIVYSFKLIGIVPIKIATTLYKEGVVHHQEGASDSSGQYGMTKAFRQTTNLP